MLRGGFGLILAGCLVTPAWGEQDLESLPTPPPREGVRHESGQQPEAVRDASPQAAPRQQNLSPAVEFGGAISVGTLVPTIASVHECDRLPLAYTPGKTIRIRGTRFEIDVEGLDQTTEYRLLACFDGETIGETDWFLGRDSYSIPTQAGFPPGRYRLSVQVFRRGHSNRVVQTPPVSINYQPTYLREMQHLGGRDVSAVSGHRAISHRPSTIEH